MFCSGCGWDFKKRTKIRFHSTGVVYDLEEVSALLDR